MRKLTIILSICIVALFALNMLSFASGRGTVVDKDGKPIPGAEVYVMRSSDQGWEIPRVFTDSHGRFNFIPKGNSKHTWVNYIVLAEGYSFGRGYGDLADNKDATITLVSEQKLKGIVVDEQGKPIPGVKITVERVHAYGSRDLNSVEFNFNSNDLCISQAITRGDGTFTLNHLPSPEDFGYGGVVISARMQSMALVIKDIELKQLDEELLITLPRECALAGTLYLPNKADTAPEGFPLILWLVNAGWHRSREISIGKDGRFLASQLEPGNYRLITGPNYYFRTSTEGVSAPPQPDWVLPAEEISIGADEAKVIELVAVPGAIIKGKVLSKDDNAPVPNAVVAAFHAGRPEGTVPTCAITDEKGEFTVRVAAGDVKLSVNSIELETQSHTLQEGEKPTLTFKIAEGEQKTDLVMKVNIIDPYDHFYADEPYNKRELEKLVNKKPIIKDLVLKPGSYSLKWDPEMQTYNMRTIPSSKKDDETQKIISKQPKLASEKARYLAFNYDGPDPQGLLLAIMDESHGTGTGYDTVYFDRNRNADLSDDEPVKLPRRGMYRYAYSKWAKVQVYQGKQRMRRNLATSVRLRYYKNTETDDINLEIGGGWRGKIGSNKGLLDCVIPATNSDGIAAKNTTRVDIYGSGIGDNIYIDTNGYGKATVAWDSPQRVQLNVPAKVGSRYYDIIVSGYGRKINIKPFTGKLGKLSVTSSGISGFKAKPVEVTLYNDNGEYTFDLTKGPAVIPAGTYKMDHCTFNLENKKGEKTNLSCFTHDRLVIQPSKQTNLDISGKVSLEIAPGAKYLSLDSLRDNYFSVRAKIGERITVTKIGVKTLYGSAYEVDGKVTPPVELFSDSGELLATAKSKYEFLSWKDHSIGFPLPVLKPGSGKVRITIDTKTPLGKFTAQKAAIIREPAIREALTAEYENAVKAGDAAKAEDLKKAMLDKLYTWRIKQGEPIEVAYRNYGEFPTKDKLSGIAKFYAGKDYLRAYIDVTDAYFSTDPYEGRFYRASSVAFYVTPSGLYNHREMISVIPRGKGGVPTLIQTNLPGVIARYARTPKGYWLDVKIPWKILKAYNKDWKLMPVGIMLNSRTGKDRTQLNFTQGTDSYDDPRGFAALMAPSVGGSAKSSR